MGHTKTPDAQDVFQRVLEAAPNGIVAADFRGSIVLVNKTAEELFGYSRIEFLQLKIEDLVPENLRKGHLGHRQQYAKAATTRAMGQGRDLYAVRKDGKEFPVEIGITPVDTPEGKLIVSSIVDITERKNAEDKLTAYATELQHSNQALQKQAEILANIHDAVFMVRSDGILLSWNRGAETIYGYSSEEVIGKSAEMLLPKEDSGRCGRIMKTVAEHQKTEETVWCVTKSGKRIAVAVRATQTQGEDHSGAVICAHDITEQKRLEEQVLHASEKEQRRIGQDIHDDLCQQLASIGCLTKVLEQRLRNVYEEGAEHLSQIGDMVSQANVRAREIAKGLVPAVLETEGLIGALEDLASSTEQIYAPVKCRLRASKRIKLGSLEEMVQLFRIAQEAVNNAVKHAAPALITIHLFEEGSNVRLRIHDDGHGMQDSTNIQSGLGLLTMAHRARALGGEFEIRTTEENGTTVECLVHFP